MVLRFLPLLLAVAAAALRAQPSCENTPAYTPCDLVLELSDSDAAAHPNPYASVELKAEFRSPRHHTFLVPGFWDGGHRMVLRFAPTEPGQWDYRMTSNVAAWDGKTGSFHAAESESPGFIRPANVHHWAYTERNLPHLWMGANETRFAFIDDSAFRNMVDARAAQKFNHVRGLVLDAGDASFPDLAQAQRLDARIRYLNQKGIIADLILASGPAEIARRFPDAAQRRRFAEYLAGRYAGFNITWQGVEQFEDYPGARAVLKEIGSGLKEADAYQHPRTSGARVTSAPLLDDAWMNFVAYGTADDSVPAIEHQLYGVPSVALNVSGEDGSRLRHRLWNATMNGQYPTCNCPAGTEKAFTVWYDFFADTRHWELEPYFDVDGGRAVALDDTEYIVYVENPGPVEVLVQKHGYDVYWVDPATGETTRQKFKGDHFTGEAPAKGHDWVLHIVREGHLESMNRSYKFESRPIVLQEIEQNVAKVPFEVEQPSAEVSVSKPVPYAAKIKRETRATRSMMWLWTGEVPAEGQGYRVLGSAQKGTFQFPRVLAKNQDAVMNMRVFGMNANGKVYALDKALGLAP
jgi:hypothetical protein